MMVACSPGKRVISVLAGWIAKSGLSRAEAAESMMIRNGRSARVRKVSLLMMPLLTPVCSTASSATQERRNAQCYERLGLRMEGRAPFSLCRDDEKRSSERTSLDILTIEVGVTYTLPTMTKRWAFLAVISLFWCSIASAQQVPRTIEDQEFWRLVTDLSETGGVFPQQFMSNEDSAQFVIPSLKEK